ncbi:hypothetical protein D8674_018988 [Pyrus ussuriensis x Pyrus communis]|uniref:Uncharacterized protein n=1 Tax=Pyrus ussuriensis x Pyrus communis TaxID=2448454 RepID=A0A5N5G6G2_9ROSA|nr:hypothetical protein D8674_018988 [Pyrus ussuriensis x Pyrus communis]
MVHKASVVYMIPIIILLLFSSKVAFANVSENPKQFPDLVIADDVEKIISRSRLQMEIIQAMKVGVPKPTMPSGNGNAYP